MAKIIPLNDDVLNVGQVLEKAKDLKEVVVLGIDRDDNEFYGSSIQEKETLLWLLERCKHFLMTLEGI